MKRSARITHNGRLLWIIQDGKTDLYVVDYLPIAAEMPAYKAIKLTKADRTEYIVTQNEFGVSCSCADASYRSHECKHATALKAHKILGSHGYKESQDEEATQEDTNGPRA